MKTITLKDGTKFVAAIGSRFFGSPTEDQKEEITCMLEDSENAISIRDCVTGDLAGGLAGAFEIHWFKK